MRWWLLPLLLLALLAPRQECAVRQMLFYPTPPGQTAPPGVMEVGGIQMALPPVRIGHPVAPLGTDQAGRDSRCLLMRGLGRSMGLGLLVLLLGLLPGALLGVWVGWHGRLVALPHETMTLLILVLLGSGAFRLVLVLGAALLTARLVAAQVDSVMREPFVEGALALGAGPAQVMRRHLLPFLLPTLPVVVTTLLSGIFLWMMEFGALGFYDQGVIKLEFGDGFDRTQVNQDFPLGADLGQLVSAGRWEWLSTPELLALPLVLLLLLTLAFKDLSRRLAAPE